MTSVLQVFIFIANLVPFSESSPLIHENHEYSNSHKLHSIPIPSPPPQVRVTIVNATSIPSIALSTSGTNTPATYPDFHQGEWTCNESVETPDIDYVARNTEGLIIAQQSIHYKNISSQFLLLTENLNMEDTHNPREPIPAQMRPETTNTQCNLEFHVIPYMPTTTSSCYYRIINAMPHKELIIKKLNTEDQFKKPLAILKSGGSVLFIDQAKTVDYGIEIEGQNYQLSIKQEGIGYNCLIPFFLKDGHPNFLRIFENP